jgi:hypothetical protein
MLGERFWPNIGDNQWFPVAVPYRSHQIAVHPSDELEGYLLRAHHFTLAMIRTTAEVFVGHRDHRAESPLVTLGLTLPQCVTKIAILVLNAQEIKGNCDETIQLPSLWRDLLINLLCERPLFT